MTAQGYDEGGLRKPVPSPVSEIRKRGRSYMMLCLNADVV